MLFSILNKELLRVLMHLDIGYCAIFPFNVTGCLMYSNLSTFFYKYCISYGTYLGDKNMNV